MQAEGAAANASGGGHNNGEYFLAAPWLLNPEFYSINDILHDDAMFIIFSHLNNIDAKTLMIVVPQVCHGWRNMCQYMRTVHLDFSWRIPWAPFYEKCLGHGHVQSVSIRSVRHVQERCR